MTSERFLALVAAYGADARRWPEAERAAAQALAAARPEAVAHALDRMGLQNYRARTATALGYTRLYWYRDGLDAWEADTHQTLH